MKLSLFSGLLLGGGWIKKTWSNKSIIKNLYAKYAVALFSGSAIGLSGGVLSYLFLSDYSQKKQKQIKNNLKK